MKGIVFSMNRNAGQGTTSFFRFRPRFSLKRFITYYGISTLFFMVFLLGFILGVLSYDDFSADFLNKLDFLFLTNLNSRLELKAFEIFCSGFTSYIIFVFIACILGFSAFGVFALAFLCAFKGVGVGMSCALLISEHSITGLGFYILVILPGTVLFLLAFLLAMKESFSLSASTLKCFFTNNEKNDLKRYVKPYFFRYLIISVFAVFSALVDMIMWVLFANMFNLGV